jgi:hypothetical protein
LEFAEDVRGVVPATDFFVLTGITQGVSWIKGLELLEAMSVKEASSTMNLFLFWNADWEMDIHLGTPIIFEQKTATYITTY